jgi:hypothetical protein
MLLILWAYAEPAGAGGSCSSRYFPKDAADLDTLRALHVAAMNGATGQFQMKDASCLLSVCSVAHAKELTGTCIYILKLKVSE